MTDSETFFSKDKERRAIAEEASFDATIDATQNYYALIIFSDVYSYSEISFFKIGGNVTNN